MSSWRDQILREFTPKVARLTLVADPDSLLLEESILADIRERGFQLILFEDHVAFRYAYESKFRSRWDQGEHTDLVVVLRSDAADLSRLPYDLLHSSRQISFSLSEIFPNLSYPIVTALDRRDLDALYESQKNHNPSVMGDNTTKEFILWHVFGIKPEFIRKPSDLLTVLLRRHYRAQQRIPDLLDERFVQVLRQQGSFDDWPLETIIPDRESFFAFLQERWPIFLTRSAEQIRANTHEDETTCQAVPSGVLDLPFDHVDVRVYIDNLFLEGFLEAVPHEQAESLSTSWLAVGIRTTDQSDRTYRVNRLLDTLAGDIPGQNAPHHDWFHFARTWAELIALALDSNEMLPMPERQKMETIQAQVDSTLMPWLTDRYAGLASLPPAPPVMLHHIPRFMSRHISDANKNKVGFIMMDGLSLDQWIVIRKDLVKQRTNYRIRENAVFAWIPTITTVSRQATFAGKPPIYFPNSIHTTDKEPTLWTQFWVDYGLTQQEVTYAKGLGDGTLETVIEMVAQPRIRVVGLVVDKVDKIMHGMELGTAGMHNQVRQWARQPFMVNLIDLLLENGFRVYLTSDHGNIEATGCGRPAEGSVADLRGERVRIYSDSLLRGQVKRRFPDAVDWPPIGLPEDYFPLLAAGRSAFVRESERVVGHGGTCLEELIVPFVQIDLRDT